MKILILKPQKICYGIMEIIANNFGNALSRAGVGIIYFDIKKEPVKDLINYIKEEYQAVIDIYSGLLNVRMGEEYLWNCVNAPIFQICVDFPVYVMEKMETKLRRCYALCIDRHYCDVIRECLPNISDSFFPRWQERKGRRRLHGKNAVIISSLLEAILIIVNGWWN